jgi:hypothetical protein
VNDKGLRFGRALVAAGFTAAMVLLAGCGPVKLVANTNIPPPLVMKVPIGVALFIPTEFSSYVHKEERWSTKWQIELGQAQTDGITRLMNAMFERVVTVESVNAGTQVPGGVSAILEPSIEEYAFVTPRDAGSPFYAVSIKYRVNVYAPDGKLADSWGFTGYGTSPSQGLSSEAPLHAATASAMRDAGAKLAVEFREQAVMRGLMPGGQTADSPPTETAPAEPAAGTATEPTETTPPPAETQSTTPAAPAAPGATTPPEGTEPPASAPAAPPEEAKDEPKEEPKDEASEAAEPEKPAEPVEAEPSATDKKIPKQPIAPEAFLAAPPMS